MAGWPTGQRGSIITTTGNPDSLASSNPTPINDRGAFDVPEIRSGVLGPNRLHLVKLLFPQQRCATLYFFGCRTSVDDSWLGLAGQFEHPTTRHAYHLELERGPKCVVQTLLGRNSGSLKPSPSKVRQPWSAATPEVRASCTRDLQVRIEFESELQTRQAIEKFASPPLAPPSTRCL